MLIFSIIIGLLFAMWLAGVILQLSILQVIGMVIGTFITIVLWLIKQVLSLPEKVCEFLDWVLDELKRINKGNRCVV